MLTQFLETYNTNILRILITITIIVLLVYIVILIRNLRIMSQTNKKIEKNNISPEQQLTLAKKLRNPNPRLGKEDIDNVLTEIISEIITSKYLLKYKMTDKMTFPDYEAETKKIAEEVINSLGEEFADDLTYFYSEEYICASITRKVQIILVKYLDQNKPPIH